MPHLVDIIIPMYNRAEYVLNIITQLENQTFKDFKAIFVDDGSTDNTYEKLSDELKNSKLNYEIIKKQNGGASSARNAGILASSADWIMFADSDDGFCEQYIDYMFNSVSQSGADLGICQYQMVIEGSNTTIDKITDLKYKVITPSEAMQQYCHNWIGVYCLIMSRCVQQKHKIFFDEDCCYNEDAPFIANVIAKSSKVAYLEQKLYFYYTHAGSLHRSPRLDKYYSAIKSFSAMEEQLLNSSSPAAQVFNNMGSARFYIATLRRAAVQLSFKAFKELEKSINFRKYKKQINNLLPSQKIACYMLLASKTLFYHGMRLFFKD